MPPPHDYFETESDADALAPVMNMIGPMAAADAGLRANAGHLHVNRSTLIIPVGEAAGMASSMQYLSDNEEISHVLLAGPDSLSLPAVRLRETLAGLGEIEHVRMIRLCSRVPALHPERIVRNREFLDLLSEYAGQSRSIYVMMRFHLPEEVDSASNEAFQALSEAGAGLLAEVPFLPGVNADPEALAELMNRLTRAGVIPYQFVLDAPRPGARQKAITLEKAYRLAEAVKSRISGPARRARLTMKHPSGFFEILAIENGKAYLKSHLSRHDGNGRFTIKDCPPDAKSFEDLANGVLSERTGKTPSSTTYLKVPYEIPD